MAKNSYFSNPGTKNMLIIAFIFNWQFFSITLKYRINVQGKSLINGGELTGSYLFDVNNKEFMHTESLFTIKTL